VSSPANAVTAINAPAGIESTKVVKEMRSRFGVILTDGQGAMKGHMFRLAHLGYYDFLDLMAVLGALEIALLKVGHKVELGSGVRAAQNVYLRREA
jgi:aspartate aminotransferase-like enzyme